MSTLPVSKAFADAPPPYFSAALELWSITAPEQHKSLFSTIKFLPVTDTKAPLARYIPPENKGGRVEIGQNLREYKRDYIYLSSPIDMSTKPDFNQYMTVLTTLSLANESAHILQDRNKSIDDFFKFYKAQQFDKACGLYALQQHVSDIAMLKTALSLEKIFLGQGSEKGLNALRLALEKNELRDEFESFREAMKNQDTPSLNDALKKIRTKRNALNMAGLTFCPSSGQIELDKKMIARATEPVGFPFTIKSNPAPKNPLAYNP